MYDSDVGKKVYVGDTADSTQQLVGYKGSSGFGITVNEITDFALDSEDGVRKHAPTSVDPKPGTITFIRDVEETHTTLLQMAATRAIRYWKIERAGGAVGFRGFIKDYTEPTAGENDSPVITVTVQPVELPRKLEV